MPEEEKLVAEIKPLMAASIPVLNKLKAILEQGDNDALATFSAQDLYPAIDPLSDKFSALIEIQLDVAKQEYDAALAAESRNFNLTLGIAVSAIAAGIFLALLIARQIGNELGGEPADVAAVARRVAAGQLADVVTIRPGHESSVLRITSYNVCYTKLLRAMHLASA